MRRLISLVTLVVVSTVVSAAESRSPGARLGRAMVLEPAHALTAADQDELAAKGIVIR